MTDDIKLNESFSEDEEFDPLAAHEFDIDQEDMEDENPYDTVDYPTVRNMPEHMQREAVFTPATQGSAKAALEALFDRNPARRPELLAIIDLCRDGCASSTINEKIGELQKDNRSVYAPLTLCRMLQRAGGLEVEQPQSTEEALDEEEGVEYLEITSVPDPVWTATEAALELHATETSGGAFRDIVNRDGGGKYAEVYRTVLEGLAAEPRKRAWIEDTVDQFEIVQHPRRFGGHFIDMLEKTYCIAWKNPCWHITELGHLALSELSLAAVEATDAQDGVEQAD